MFDFDSLEPVPLAQASCSDGIKAWISSKPFCRNENNLLAKMPLIKKRENVENF
jgi:hypothetical protein